MLTALLRFCGSCLPVFLLASMPLAASAGAEPMPLVGLSAEAADPGVTFTGNGGTAQIIDGDAGKVLAITIGKDGGHWPGVNIAPKRGAWDLADYSAVRFSITNTSGLRIRVHGRVDNPGDWRKKPWSVNAVTLRPGQSKTLTVPFGRQYGNAGYDLDPAKVARVVIFGERPKGDITLHVTAIEAVTAGVAGGSAGSDDKPGASADGNDAAQAPQSNVLYDFERGVTGSLIADDNATHEVVEVDGGKAMRVSFGGGNYPGVQLNAPGGGWDLSNYAGVEVDVTNPGDKGVTVALRIDNPGNWKKNPWNAEKTHVKAGQTRTIRVKFGQSWGGPGFALNPAKVIRALVYAERPRDGAVLLADNLRAYGQATVREADTVDLGGVLFDFGPGFIPAGRVEGRGASAKVEGGQLIATFSADQKWPAVYLTPVARKWDLSNFASIQMQVTNQSRDKARVSARVDNPGADGRNNCNTEAITIAPGQTRTLTVTFGKSWGKAGFDLDASNVVGVLVMIDQPSRAYTLAIDDIKANPRQSASVPDWIGQRPPVEGDWVQTLDEEFDGPTLDESRWRRRFVWDGPAEAETQRYIQENVYVRDGKLVIECEKNPGHQYNDPKLPTREYATGVATTLDKWTQAYGYFEARIKSPRARGLWPAFWMMPDRGEGHGNIWERRATENGGMEIDIWEHLTEWGPGRYNVAAHWDGYGKDHKQWGNAHIYHLPTDDGWHNYGLLWEPGKLTWFCDGKRVETWEDPQVTKVPTYLLLTVQMGNWATDDVDDAALPDKLQVEYVRAWQLRERID